MDCGVSMGKNDLVGPKVLVWDIEASDLAADYGFVFCIGWKWLGCKDVNLIKIRSFKRFKSCVYDDTEVLKAFWPVMERADVHVTWYGAGFDLPFIQTRAMIKEVDPFPKVPHIDCWRIARNQLKFQSNRLDNVSRRIPVKAGALRELKTPVDAEHWMAGKAGNVKSLKYIEEHCAADIRVLENVYLALRKYAPQTLPNLSKYDGTREEGCPHCGSMRIQSRGKALTTRGVRGKYQCQECKGWFTLPIKVKVE
jgi:uncharacterized protein YprB with RNaseH-like and TPR domain